MAMEHEDLASQFHIDVGLDEETQLEVASIVRDDGRHLNLLLVNDLMDLALVNPQAFDLITDLVVNLTVAWEQA